MMAVDEIIKVNGWYTDTNSEVNTYVLRRHFCEILCWHCSECS